MQDIMIMIMTRMATDSAAEEILTLTKTNIQQLNMTEACMQQTQEMANTLAFTETLSDEIDPS